MKSAIPKSVPKNVQLILLPPELEGQATQILTDLRVDQSVHLIHNRPNKPYGVFGWIRLFFESIEVAKVSCPGFEQFPEYITLAGVYEILHKRPQKYLESALGSLFGALSYMADDGVHGRIAIPQRWIVEDSGPQYLLDRLTVTQGVQVQKGLYLWSTTNAL